MTKDSLDKMPLMAHFEYSNNIQSLFMSHGGKRFEAGRPKGKGIYGESTVNMRVSERLAEGIKQFAVTKGFRLPLCSSSVQAGVFTEAGSDIEDIIDLNSFIVRNPATTFLVRDSCESMIDAGIRDGDLLVADSGIELTEGKIVIAAVDNQFTVQFMHVKNGKLWLMPSNKTFSSLLINKTAGASNLGVVASSIQSH